MMILIEGSKELSFNIFRKETPQTIARPGPGRGCMESELYEALKCF